MPGTRVNNYEKQLRRPGDPGRLTFNSRQYAELLRYISRHVPAQEVEDVIQEAYKRYYACTNEFIANHQGYVHGIACNVVLDFWARRNNQTVRFDSRAAQQADENPHRPAPDPVSSQVSAGHEIAQVLDKLPRAQRAVLVLRVGEGYSTGEIARHLKLSIHTVKKYVTRALQLLRSATKGSLVA
jgi:RNA polymerase sigma factor (sigma-70 family)